MTNKTVSLVLGSGGARGLAHIGAIHYLMENDYDIRSISGCSIGAFVGGVFALGKLDVFEEWIRPITKFDMVKLLDVSWGKEGLVEGDRIFTVFRELIGDRRIEDLSIQYTAVAADIQNEKEVWLKRGLLFDAIRASTSLPLFFTPYEINGTKLLDGGILNPVPIAPTFEDDTDLTIAINLGAPPTGNSKPMLKSEPKNRDDYPEDGIRARINDFVEELRSRNPVDAGGKRSMLKILDQTFDSMQGTIARHKLAAYPPDHTIMIARDACGTMEFDRADEMIALGYDAAARSLGK